MQETEINGRFTKAKVHVENVDFESYRLLQHLCNLDTMEGVKIRVMPDICPGFGTTIGSTFTYDKYLLPVLVSGDIGCGVTCLKLNLSRLDSNQLDKVIRENLVAQKRADSILEKHRNAVNLKDLICAKYINIEKCYQKIGELGNGNHFLEMDSDDEGFLWLTIHSGSRLLGQQVYDYYLSQGDQHNTRMFASLEGDVMQAYLHDVEIATEFASENRKAVAEIICRFLKVKILDEYESRHNYVDTAHRIIRKGAISAQNGERVVIPISASPAFGGVILGLGKGNEEWNYSAPHGAGRLCSIKQAKELYTKKDLETNLSGVKLSKVGQPGIEEGPMVYRRREELLKDIGDLISIERILTPIFNYKE